MNTKKILSYTMGIAAAFTMSLSAGAAAVNNGANPTGTPNAGNAVGGAIGGVANGVGDVAGGVANGVGDVAGGVANGVADVVGGAANGVADVVNGVAGGVADAVDNGQNGNYTTAPARTTRAAEPTESGTARTNEPAATNENGNSVSYSARANAGAETAPAETVNDGAVVNDSTYTANGANAGAVNGAATTAGNPTTGVTEYVAIGLAAATAITLAVGRIKPKH